MPLSAIYAAEDGLSNGISHMHLWFTMTTLDKYMSILVKKEVSHSNDSSALVTVPIELKFGLKYALAPGDSEYMHFVHMVRSEVRFILGQSQSANSLQIVFGAL